MSSVSNPTGHKLREQTERRTSVRAGNLMGLDKQATSVGENTDTCFKQMRTPAIV